MDFSKVLQMFLSPDLESRKLGHFLGKKHFGLTQKNDWGLAVFTYMLKHCLEYIDDKHLLHMGIEIGDVEVHIYHDFRVKEGSFNPTYIKYVVRENDCLNIKHTDIAIAYRGGAREYIGDSLEVFLKKWNNDFMMKTLSYRFW